MNKKISVIVGILMTIFLGMYVYQNLLTIDIVVPVYNSAKYLPKCLDSIFAQKGNYKVIVVDDGSTDESSEIIKKYAQKHPNIIMIKQKNQGVSVARNTGYEKGKNKYVMFVDSDDWLEPEVIERITKVLKKDKPQILLSGYNDIYDEDWIRHMTKGKINEADIKPIRIPVRNLDKLALFSPFYEKDALNDLFYAGTGVRGQVFERKFVEASGVDFQKGLSCGEDDVFIFRLFLHNPLISIIPDSLYNYRNRMDSLAKSVEIIKKNRKGLLFLQNTKEYKTASHREQMLLEDTWLSWTLIGLSNLQRNNYPEAEGTKEAYQIYQTFSKYNSEELKNCRHFRTLQKYLFGENFNRPF